MSVFSTNQARQLYVAKLNDSATAPADLDVNECFVKKSNKNEAYFVFKTGQSNILRSDLIRKSDYSIKVTKGEAVERKLKKFTLEYNPELNNGDLVVGQDYILHLNIGQAYGLGEDNVDIKFGAVRTSASMTPTQFWTKMADSVKNSCKKDLFPLIDVEAVGESLVITEKELPSIPRVGSVMDGIKIDITCNTVNDDGDEVGWLKINQNTHMPYTVEDSDQAVANAKIFAELEWFCHGEKGDIYRGVGYPNSIHTEYDVDIKSGQNYSCIDIHFSYQGTCEDIQKSEKDLTIIVPESAKDSDANAQAIVEAFENILNPPTPPTPPVTTTATITYTSEYGTAPEASEVTLTDGSYELVAADLPTLTAAEHTFNGWCKSGETTVLVAGATISGDTTLVASWD